MVKINSLEAENVKRIKAVKLEPTQNGLTIIGGRNNQGKTSVLDTIAWVLGGNRFKPSQPAREGSVTPPDLKVVLDNGLVVQRKGKNSDLKVLDPEGKKSGQALLDSFVSELALDLPKFMNGSSREKADTLLNIIGVGDRLYELENQEEQLMNQRLGIGQMQRQKQGAADEMETYPEAPVEPVSASELIQKQQAILAKNGENQQLRMRAQELVREQNALMQEVNELQERLAAKRQALEDVTGKVATAAKSVEQLVDESTAEIEESISEIDEINRKVRVNQQRTLAEKEAVELKEQYDDLSAQIDSVRDAKVALLKGADLPLPGLSVEGTDLTYNGCKWDSMSGSDQLKVATAIVRKLNPNCGFVLVDKLEQLDLQTLEEFGAWAEAEGLQVIATRVSTGDECSILIEDGYGSNVPSEEAPEPVAQPWATGGAF